MVVALVAAPGATAAPSYPILKMFEAPINNAENMEQAMWPHLN